MAQSESNKLKLSYVKSEPKSSEGSLFTTLPGAIEYFSKTKPEAEAFVFASTDGSREVVTWGELCKKSQHVAKCFMELGIQQYEIVAVNVRPCPEWLFITFGAMFAGAIPVNIPFTSTDGSDVIALMEKLGNCAMIVVDPGANDKQWNILNGLLDEYSADGKVRSNKMSYLRHMVVTNCPRNIENVLTLDQLMSTVTNKDVTFPEIAEDDVAALFQTSGSTGVPKLVAHTYRSCGALLTYSEETKEKFDFVMFNDRPFGWFGGFPFNVWIGHGRITVSGKCPPPEDKIGFMIDVIKREKCAIVAALPPQLHELTQRKDDLGDDWPVKYIMTGGQPITKQQAMSAGAVSPFVANGYGCAETSTISLLVIAVENAKDFKDYATGKVSQGIELKIVDKDGAIVPVNTRGTILLRSRSMFKGYWNDPGKTKAVKTSDGWFNTDDIGTLDEDSTLYVLGRQSNMIVSGGINVAPETLENGIKLCPGVDVAIVVPVPDEVLYQAICACIILKPEGATTEQEIRMFCEEKHNDKEGSFNVLPKYYMVLESFPETFSGKVSRPKLIAMATAKFKS